MATNAMTNKENIAAKLVETIAVQNIEIFAVQNMGASTRHNVSLILVHSILDVFIFVVLLLANMQHSHLVFILYFSQGTNPKLK